MARAGEMNVGQLVREHYGKNAVLVGFSTSNGTVTAASNWGGPAERKIVRPALGDSFEGLFHETDLPRFLLTFRGGGRAASVLDKPMLERAIGVIYRPETERMSHYFHARITDQFDAVLHFDHTRAVEPLERTAEWEEGELPETYPTGM
jgi:erythromycin esterase-like protein